MEKIWLEVLNSAGIITSLFGIAVALLFTVRTVRKTQQEMKFVEQNALRRKAYPKDFDDDVEATLKRKLEEKIVILEKEINKIKQLELELEAEKKYNLWFNDLKLLEEKIKTIKLNAKIE